MMTDRNGYKVTINESSPKRFEKAKQTEKVLSDTAAPLSETRINALQLRGEKEIVTSDGYRLLVRIDQTKCMGAESCVTVAPSVFSLDTRQLGLGRKGKEPLGVKKVIDRAIDSEMILLAAQSCPYHAIYVKNMETGDQLAG